MARHAKISRGQVEEAFRACRGALIGVALVSSVINILYLTGSFFMLEIYDRVLPSRSMPTLVVLAILAAALYLFQGALDMIRSRVLIRIGASIDEDLHEKVFEAIIRMPLISGPRGEAIQPLRELDQVRAFMSGTGPAALFDLPWLPLYLTICFLFHSYIGWTALLGAVILIVLTVVTDLLARRPTQAAAALGSQRHVLAEASRRNAEVLGAMGMGGRLTRIWSEKNAEYIKSQQTAADLVGSIGAITKVARMLLQSAVLAVGAYLVIMGEATAGVIIASSILTARALAPVELAVANWRSFVAARQGARRIKDLFALIQPDAQKIDLPKPTRSLSAENVSGGAPGYTKLVVQDVAFLLHAGQGLGVIGPSASGKSSLARVIVGIWTPARGKIRLDGAALDQWSTEALGDHIGYLPQMVELFAGTVADNISRFEADAPSEAIIAAARQAGVHDIIVRFPEGYDTEIGEAGGVLSAGQRQRIALARALYRDPFVVVLDEPNSNLDAEGEAALTEALLSVRRRGGIAVVVAHRPSALAALDMLLVMKEGRVQAFGPKDEVLQKVTRQASSGSVTPASLKVVSEGPGKS